MEKAKQAVSNFISGDGKHTTTVHEEVRKGVVDEHVRPHQHENITTAVDKEVHQDHHHTTVQPLNAKETLPETHTHNVIPTEHKTFMHGNKNDVDAFLNRDASKYQDSSITHDTTHSASTAPAVSGERVHHHVHEHIQPVLQKEVVAPEVIHTTVPVHETHHAGAVHHGTTTLPPKTLEEFTSGKGTLDGRGLQKVNEFEGCPNISDETPQSDRAVDSGRDRAVNSERDRAVNSDRDRVVNSERA